MMQLGYGSWVRMLGMMLPNETREKVALLTLGTVASVIVALTTFLVATYFSSFVTLAQYNEDMSAIDVIKVELNHLKEGQEDIKEILRSK